MTSIDQMDTPFPLSGFAPLTYYNWNFISNNDQTSTVPVMIECISSKFFYAIKKIIFFELQDFKFHVLSSLSVFSKTDSCMSILLCASVLKNAQDHLRAIMEQVKLMFCVIYMNDFLCLHYS